MPDQIALTLPAPDEVQHAISLADLTLETLLDGHKDYAPLVLRLKAEWLAVKERVDAIEAEISRRMENDRATLLAHERAKIEIEYGPATDERYPAILLQIKPLVAPEDWEAFYSQTIEDKFNLRVRKRLEKYGDRVKEILDAGIKKQPGKPRLKVTHYDDALPEG